MQVTMISDLPVYTRSTHASPGIHGGTVAVAPQKDATDGLEADIMQLELDLEDAREDAARGNAACASSLEAIEAWAVCVYEDFQAVQFQDGAQTERLNLVHGRICEVDDARKAAAAKLAQVGTGSRMCL